MATKKSLNEEIKARYYGAVASVFEAQELEVLNSLWANKSARRAPKKKA